MDQFKGTVSLPDGDKVFLETRPVPAQITQRASNGINLRDDGSLEFVSEGATCRFFPRAVSRPAQTKVAGIPSFESVDYIEITTPGDPYCKPTRRVTEADKMRFAAEWEAYERSKSAKGKGFPVLSWAFIDEAHKKTLTTMGIDTLEQLVTLEDAKVDAVFGKGMAEQIRTEAQAQISYSSKIADVDGLAKKLVGAEAQNEQLLAEIERLKAAMGKDESEESDKEEPEGDEGTEPDEKVTSGKIPAKLRKAVSNKG